MENNEYKIDITKLDVEKLKTLSPGDLTDMGYENDANLSYAGIRRTKVITKEWEISKKAVSQLDKAGVPYSLVRGNHDDYMIDDFFNVPEYTDQFKGCGGFFSDPEGKYPTCREPENPEGVWEEEYLNKSSRNSAVKIKIVSSSQLTSEESSRYLVAKSG